MTEKTIGFTLPNQQSEILRKYGNIGGAGNYVSINSSEFKNIIKKITSSMAKDDFSSEDFNSKTRLLEKLVSLATEMNISLIETAADTTVSIKENKKPKPEKTEETSNNSDLGD